MQSNFKLHRNPVDKKPKLFPSFNDECFSSVNVNVVLNGKQNSGIPEIAFCLLISVF